MSLSHQAKAYSQTDKQECSYKIGLVEHVKIANI